MSGSKLVRLHTVKVGDLLTEGLVEKITPAIGGMLTLTVDTGSGWAWHLTRNESAMVGMVMTAVELEALESDMARVIRSKGLVS